MTKKRETKLKTYPWDPAEHIKTEKDVIAYLDAAFEDGDPKVIAAVLGDIARSKGMARIAKKTGLGRESLYKSFSKKGNPGLMTVLKVVQALGYRLSITSDAA
ncbi:MAG: putative addiction module antidote protein [Proteobacteria bacterium]|nr:putative addiction module antidote protein [Pseudomonadota bacterium]